jgi:large subunit ribosomal protein L4e
MFAPNKIWRRWHIKISKGQRRYATVSALAASAVAPLVMARGHRVEQLSEVPLVVADNEFEGIAKTKEAVKLLQSLGAYADIERVKASKHIRPGKGKARGRRYIQKKGPLIVHDKNPEANKRASVLQQAFRNIPGVELCHVSRLNLLQLAPGGHLGRFVIWTEAAFKKLDGIFGTRTEDSKQKLGYRPPHSLMTNADINRIINSEEVQSALKPIHRERHRYTKKKNPLKNLGALVKLNPYAFTQRRLAVAAAKPKTKKATKKDDKKVAAKPGDKGVQKPSAAKKAKNTKKRNAKFLKLLRTPAVAPERGADEKRVQL